ncbi:class I SAM-dependent methyltransferase [Herbaspirillum rubrisubalbicans]|uniref:class I SAM-dependent methyltransferase n=1 Tax=Herbaspirillum rubrisubalbicans TaxID=80842 RepID=UPI00155923CB|nr:class I SAM-dependent methyltransferase [Herbaspirillum rubrisubalbicans]
MSEKYEFTTDWFGGSVSIDFPFFWGNIFKQIVQPQKVLEIGSYEGRSTVFMMELFSERNPLEIVCIDTWEGATEHQEDGIDMLEVEKRFDQNVQAAIANAVHPINLRKVKGRSFESCCKLICDGEEGTFDWIYVDGSHKAPDVLSDALMAFKLLRVGGVLIFDDYLWTVGFSRSGNHLDTPKPGIDAFTNVFFGKWKVISPIPLYQYYLMKLSD